MWVWIRSGPRGTWKGAPCGRTRTQTGFLEASGFPKLAWEGAGTSWSPKRGGIAPTQPELPLTRQWGRHWAWAAAHRDGHPWFRAHDGKQVRPADRSWEACREVHGCGSTDPKVKLESSDVTGRPSQKRPCQCTPWGPTRGPSALASPSSGRYFPWLPSYSWSPTDTALKARTAGNAVEMCASTPSWEPPARPRPRARPLHACLRLSQTPQSRGAGAEGPCGATDNHAQPRPLLSCVGSTETRASVHAPALREGSRGVP